MGTGNSSWTKKMSRTKWGDKSRSPYFLLGEVYEKENVTRGWTKGMTIAVQGSQKKKKTRKKKDKARQPHIS